VLFTDTSTGGVPTSWYWDTGDGIYSKHAMNATHTFTKPGMYNVTLTVANEAGYSTVTKSNYITVTSPQAPVADFFSPQVDKARSNLDSVKNETLLFIDNSTGSPTSWLWDFGDGTTSTDQNPTHAYAKEGGYTVTLTIKNAIGSNTVSKYGYALVRMDEGGIIAPAYFSSNVTSGIAPLTVLFHDTTFPDVNGDYAYGREWDFGDITNYGDDYDENNSTYITHTYKKPGKYTVKLRSYDIGGGCIITKYNYITVIDPNAPVADFSINITEGYAPLTVQFNDTSQKATSRIWDFNGDEQPDSSYINPVYIYANAGTYTVNLTVSNENGTASKVAAINVLTPSSSRGGSSSGSSHSSSGSSGGSGSAGGSPEPAKNVQVKELSQAFITNGKPVKFDFPKNATSVVYVSFDAKKTFGKTTTIAEQLKGKSALVSKLPSGEVYKSFNVWVGTGGFATSKNIENPVVCFKVEKSWVKDKKIDQDSITLNRYNDKKWEQFPVSLSGEDDKFLYFTAKTSGFSSFAITGTEKPSEEIVTEVQIDYPETTNNSTASKEPQSEQKGIPSIPSFGIYYGIASLLSLLLYKRK
jgi:PGF-pre-PGF domain-containing protein